MTYDASDRKSIRRAEKAAALADRNRGEVLTAIADTTQGRRFLWDKLSEAHVFATTYDDNSGRMAFLEGERNQGLRLLNDIMQWCPDQFILMMREANERRDAEPRRPNPDSAGERPDSEDFGGDDQGSAGQSDLFDSGADEARLN